MSERPMKSNDLERDFVGGDAASDTKLHYEDTRAAMHYERSRLRESIFEHQFIADLLRTLWCRGIGDVEVMRPEVDDAGYDLVVICRGVARFIQLKASVDGSKTGKVTANARLAAKPGSCILWFVFDADTLKIDTFRWYGGSPSESLPTLVGPVAKHTRANSKGEKSERHGHHVVTRGQFQALGTIDEVVDRLFGPLTSIG